MPEKSHLFTQLCTTLYHFPQPGKIQAFNVITVLFTYQPPFPLVEVFLPDLPADFAGAHKETFQIVVRHIEVVGFFRRGLLEGFK